MIPLPAVPRQNQDQASSSLPSSGFQYHSVSKDVQIKNLFNRIILHFHRQRSGGEIGRDISLSSHLECYDYDEIHLDMFEMFIKRQMYEVLSEYHMLLPHKHKVYKLIVQTSPILNTWTEKDQSCDDFSWEDTSMNLSDEEFVEGKDDLYLVLAPHIAISLHSPLIVMHKFHCCDPLDIISYNSQEKYWEKYGSLQLSTHQHMDLSTLCLKTTNSDMTTVGFDQGIVLPKESTITNMLLSKLPLVLCQVVQSFLLSPWTGFESSEVCVRGSISMNFSTGYNSYRRRYDIDYCKPKTSSILKLHVVQNYFSDSLYGDTAESKSLKEEDWQIKSSAGKVTDTTLFSRFTDF